MFRTCWRIRRRRRGRTRPIQQLQGLGDVSRRAGSFSISPLISGVRSRERFGAGACSNRTAVIAPVAVSRWNGEKPSSA